MRTFFLFCLALLCVSIILGGGGRIAEALILSPTILEYEGKPAQRSTRTVYLKNDSVATIMLVPKVYSVVSQDMYGFPHYAPFSSDAPLAGWISFPEGTRIKLAPDKQKDVPITVDIPKAAKPGGYYATVIWEAQGAQGDVGLAPSPGVNIAISVPGKITYKGTVKDFSAAHTWFSLPVQFSLKVANEGGIHFYPEGTIEIRNMFGSLAAKIPVISWRDPARVSARTNHPNGSVLPQATRELYGTWDTFFAFGPYTAVVYLDTQEAGQLVARTSFFVVSSAVWYVWYALLAVCVVGLARFVFHSGRTFQKK
jgi:hypothetical protein